jgi:hypothetical protein
MKVTVLYLSDFIGMASLEAFDRWDEPFNELIHLLDLIRTKL